MGPTIKILTVVGIPGTINSGGGSSFDFVIKPKGEKMDAPKGRTWE
jgi:hypothetical protein